MPETRTQDEEVAITPKTDVAAARGVSARPVHDETVAPDGKVTSQRSNIEDENHGLARNGRRLPDSTEKMLAKMEAAATSGLAPHEEGDADEDEPTDDVDEATDDTADESAPDDAVEGDDTAEEGEDAPDEVAELRATAARTAERNAALVGELEAARKTPKSQRTERETALVAAESAYYEEGSVAAVRKFLSVITGAAHDSKDVDAELSGLYTDLTARELGVALDDNQRSLRDNARTRLLLARDKRDKAEAEKKPAADNSADAEPNYEAGTKYVESLLSTKNQSGTSHADEYPLLMTLSETFDSGYKPGEVIARAIRHEILTGTLDPTKTSDIDMVRTAASKIEAHYDAVAKKIEAARTKTKKPDTTTPSGNKPKVAVEASTERRQSTGAPTITNATASRAPAKNPKAPIRVETTKGKSRKDFPSEAAWKDHLLNKHFTS